MTGRKGYLIAPATGGVKNDRAEVGTPVLQVVEHKIDGDATHADEDPGGPDPFCKGPMALEISAPGTADDDEDEGRRR